MAQYDNSIVSGAALGRVLEEMKDREATVVDVDSLAGYGDTEIGYEIVSIAVTSNVVGASVSGLVINVYYNDATTPSASVTTDGNGMASLLVQTGYKYRLVFPTQQGCKAIPDVVHTASISQRSVEVEYLEADNAEGEIVKIVVEQKTAEILSKVSDIQVSVTVDGIVTAHTTDAQGQVMLTIPYGKAYTVTAPQREGWYLHEGRHTQSYTAEQSGRVIIFTYRQYASGLFIVDSDGTDYTLEQWEAAVAAGTKDNSEAKLIKVSTDQLIQEGSVFAIDIDMLRERTYGSNRAWASQNVQFNTIPLNGNSATALYYYDGLTASRLIQAEGDERAIDTLAVDQALAQSRTLAAGTDHEVVLPGFLWAVGQAKEFWLNVSEVDDILLSTRPNGTYLASTLTTNKWTCTQYNASYAWNWGTAASISSKNNSCVVLPAFAC